MSVSSINQGYDLSNIVQLPDAYLKQPLRFLINKSYLIE